MMYCWWLTRTDVLLIVSKNRGIHDVYGYDVLLMVDGNNGLLMVNKNCRFDDG